MKDQIQVETWDTKYFPHYLQISALLKVARYVNKATREDDKLECRKVFYNSEIKTEIEFLQCLALFSLFCFSMQNHRKNFIHL